MVDKVYAMSSFLQFREVYGGDVRFADNLCLPVKEARKNEQLVMIDNAKELHEYFTNEVEKWLVNKKIALFLSGGMDSAIVAKYLPAGTVAYTLKCVVPGQSVIDESARAREYCEINGHNHKIVEVYWEDYQELSPILMKRKNAPIHSIEVQLYKAALQAKKDGFDYVLTGDSADMVFGGLDGFLKKDYTYGEFIHKAAYVMPYTALKEATLVTNPYRKWVAPNGFMDSNGYVNDVFSNESANSYINACNAAGVTVVDAFLGLSHMIDIPRVREGTSKPVVRELFYDLYGFRPPEKIPLPRPMAEWLAQWEGPKRSEFWPNCHVNMTGDQKYYIWILERFLDLIDAEKKTGGGEGA